MSLHPLQDNLRISLLIRSSAEDGIADDTQRAIIATNILILEELRDLLLHGAVRELIQADPNEAVEHDHVTSEPFEQRVEIRLEESP